MVNASTCFWSGNEACVEAAILDGKNVLQTQAYGAEARGSLAKSEVIVSDGKTIEENVSPRTFENNVDAFRKGLQLGATLKDQS